MIRTSTLSYWMGQTRKAGYKGPTHGAMVFPDGSYLVVSLADHSAWNVIKAGCSVAIAVCLGRGDETTATWTVQTAGYIQKEETLRSQVGKYMAHVRAIEAETARIAANPPEGLERALKAHDWYAHYSDDNSVYVRSEDHWKTVVLPLVAKVDPATVRTLWAKYAPADVTCPV